MNSLSRATHSAFSSLERLEPSLTSFHCTQIHWNSLFHSWLSSRRLDSLLILHILRSFGFGISPSSGLASLSQELFLTSHWNGMQSILFGLVLRYTEHLPRQKKIKWKQVDLPLTSEKPWAELMESAYEFEKRKKWALFWFFYYDISSFMKRALFLSTQGSDLFTAVEWV